MAILKRLAEGIDAIVDAFGQLASWLTLALVLLMSSNVLLRYLFSAGSVGAQELEWHLLSPIVLFGMGYALLRDGHLRVDLFYVKLPLRARLGVDLAAGLVGIVFSVLVILLSLNYVRQSFVIMEGSPDPGGLPYRYVLKSLIPIGFAVLLLYSIAATIRTGLAIFAAQTANEPAR